MKEFKIKDIWQTFLYLPRIFRLLWNTNKKYLLIITTVSIINGLVPVLTLKASQNLINTIQTSLVGQFNVVIYAFIVLIVISYIGDLLGTIRSYYDEIFQNLLAYKLNALIIKKANSLSLENFEDSEVYDKITRAQGEAGQRPYQMFQSILTFITSLVTLVSSLFIVFSWKPWTLIILVFIPVISMYYFMYIGHIQFMINWKRAGKQRQSWYYSFITTHDFSVKEIKLYNLGGYFLNKYKEITKEFYKQDKKISKKKNLMGMFFTILTQLSCDFTVFLVLRSAYLREILIGDTVGLIRAISLVQSTSQGVISTIFSMYNNTLYVKQLFEFLDMKEDVDEKDGSEIEIENIDSIEFRDVSFKYKAREEMTLKNISFTLNKYDRVALVGVNGSGKTTIVKLLSGLYSPTSGSIYINGINLNQIKKSSLRKCVGVVFQDFNKYEMTLRENVGVGNVDDNFEEKKIIDACEKGETIDLINLLPKGINTQLGLWFEDGTQLSGGQWQKIAISRAYYRRSSMYILDEPSSFLDPKAERDLFEKFSNLSKDKISVFITHRFINTNFANRIIVLEDGRIIEDGNKKELISLEGVYYKMYNIQNCVLN